MPPLLVRILSVIRASLFQPLAVPDSGGMLCTITCHCAFAYVAQATSWYSPAATTGGTLSSVHPRLPLRIVRTLFGLDQHSDQHDSVGHHCCSALTF